SARGLPKCRKGLIWGRARSFRLSRGADRGQRAVLRGLKRCLVGVSSTLGGVATCIERAPRTGFIGPHRGFAGADQPLVTIGEAICWGRAPSSPPDFRRFSALPLSARGRCAPGLARNF